ncbi:MAG TPA: hypothetical protein VKF41_07815 [Bryobacteraceae bacterium]|nr:hypothetical protein [Bryobacteraceae bacterium]
MTLFQAFGAYPYLFSDVLLLSGILLAVRAFPLAAHRRLILRLGLLMIPNFLFSLAHPDYWNPVRVGGWVVGLEDVVFAFIVGAMGCLPAVWLSRHQLIVAERPAPRIGRLLAVGIPAQCAFLLLLSMGRSSMGSAVLAQFLAGASLLLLRPDLWRFSAGGGLGFSLMYCGIVKALFGLWPDFVSSWKSTPPWGLLLFGIPLGEIAWAVSFGLFLPLFAGFVFDLRLSARARAAAPREQCDGALAAEAGVGAAAQ